MNGAPQTDTQPAMDTIQDLPVDLLANLLLPFTDLIAAYIFGSVAQGKAHRQSDIDVALLFKATEERTTIHSRTLTIGTLLEHHLPTAVDVVALNLAPVAFQFQILQTGLLVLERNRTERCLFQMQVMSRYYDAKPFLRYHQATTVRRIQEKGLGHGYHGHRDALA
ncbi:MAG: nucleotidyltransferase domain-containing protein, partial [Caldilineaceae bacterium]|nr:nucleotidyltransferase domain-containing protein [Caldilineaceae bacterium]